jgi:outer membrane protein W
MAFSAVAQFHFGDGPVVPYVGGGIAYVTGDAETPEEIVEPGEPAEVDFESQTGLIANAGVDFRITPNLAIGADVKYIPYEAVEEGASDIEALDVNPLIFSAAVKFRF